MYSYHTGLVLKIDILLLSALVFFTIVIIVYAMIKEYSFMRRGRALLNIKKDVYALTFSGQKIDEKVCFPIASGITARQFLDVSTNRIREAAFFNEAEQKIFQQCFVSEERLTKIKRIALNAWSKWRRIEAILSLGYAHAENCLETLEKSIEERDSDIAYFSIIALGQIKTISSARVLLDFLSRHKIYYYKIFSVLENFPAQIAGEVIRLTLDKDPQLRVFAVKLLSRLKAQQYLKKIEEMTLDESEEVCAAACDCLGEMGNKEVKGVLVKCLADDSWLVRVRAIRALSQVLGKECLPEVISRINDSSLSVIDSLKAVIAEQIEAAIPYIEKFLQGNDEIARRVSIEVLGTTGYIAKVIDGVFSDSEGEKSRAIRFLESLIISRAYAGLEGALLGLNQEKKEKILSLIRNKNKELAEQIEKNISEEAKKLA